MKVVVAVPHSHTWLWSTTCVASLHRNPPVARGCDVEVVVVDNSPWSPSIKGITNTRLGNGVTVVTNKKSNKFHASALDQVVEDFSFDYLVTLETDVLATKPTWLQWFIDQMKPTDYAVGHWHHESFMCPSCTLYRGNVLRGMLTWCKTEAPQDELRWGPDFSQTMPLDNNLPLSENPAAVLENIKGWVCGPFAEKRGWPAGTRLSQQPSGQLKSGGWYEPGQQLHHWAVDQGWTYTVCPTMTTNRSDNLPLQTLYGSTMPDPLRQLEACELFGNAEAAHMWGGTRALDILKHPVTCQFVKSNTPMWLAREARYWREVVPQDVQAQTLDLIRKHGWHITGQSNDVPGGNERDRAAVEYIRECYAAGGVTW